MRVGLTRAGDARPPPRTLYNPFRVWLPEHLTPHSRQRAARLKEIAMTNITVSLPDELAQRARNAGLLNDSAIRQLLEEAMRRDAGRRLLQVAEQLHAAGVPTMSEEEIVAEVKSARAEQRSREAQQNQDSKKS